MGWVQEKWEDTWDEVKETGQEFVDFIVDDIVEPVVNTIGNVIEAALDNPVKTIAQIAAIATGQYWALPLIEGADVAAKGGDLGDVLEATAKAYIAGELGAMVGNAVGSAVTEAGTAATYGVTEGSKQYIALAAQEAGMQTAAQTIGSIAGRAASAATVAVVYGTDPVKAFVTGGVSAAVPAVLGQVPGFDKLPNTAKEVISSSVTAQLTGGNVTVAAINGAVRGSGVVTSILNNYDPPTDANGNPIPPEKRKMNDAQRALATQTLSSGAVAAFMGKPVSPAIQQAMILNGTMALGNMMTSGFKTSTDKVTTQVEKADKTATAMEKNIAQQKTAADNFNTVAGQLNARIAKQGELEANYNTAVATHNANPSQATADAANAAAKVYNDYATALSTDYTDSFKPLLDARQAELTARQKEFDDLEAVYKDEVKAVTEATNALKTPLKTVLIESDKAFVAALDPNFNPAEYRRINNLGADVDVYDHWLGDGQFKGLATNQKDADVKASIDRYVAATGKQPPDDVRSVLGVSSNPSRDVAVKEYVDTAIKDLEQRQKFTNDVNKAVLDAYKAEGLTDAQINQRIASGEVAGHVNNALERKRESVANLQQYAKYARDTFGEKSSEYKTAYRNTLDAMAAVGGYGVTKDGDSFTHTTAGKFDGNTDWDTTNSYFENPVTGRPHIIVNDVGEAPSAIRSLYRRIRGEDGGLSAIWALGQSANPPSSGGGSIFGDGSGVSSGLPGLTLLAQDNGRGDAGAKMFGSSNGFALLMYSDGRAAVVNPQTLEVEFLTPEQIREIEKTQPLKDIKPAVVESEVKDPKLIEEKPPEEKPPEEKPPEEKPPEVKPPEVTPPEVTPPEVKPPEVKPPEVKPPEKVDAAKLAAEAVKNSIQTPQDVTDAMKALGYTPTPDEVKQFTGDKTPEQLETEVTNFTDPRTVTAEEVLAAYRELGLDKPTQSDINKLVGQYAETDLSDKAKQALNTAQYNSALERLDAASKDAAANAAKVLEKAAEYEKAGADRDAALAKAIETVATEAGATKAAIGSEANLPTRDDAANAMKVITGSAPYDKKYDWDGNGKIELSDAINMLKSAAGMDTDTPPSPDTPWNKPSGLYAKLDAVQKNVLDKAAEHERAGASRDEALGKAVEDVAKDLGTTKEAIGKQIGAPATTDASGKPVEATGVYRAIADSAAATQADAQAKYSALSAGQKQLADDLVKQGATLGGAIATVEANVKADAQSKYEALTAGQKKLADDLVKQGADLGGAIATVEANIKADAQSKYDALDAGQKKLADDLAKQGVDLGVAIETAAASVRTDAQNKFNALDAGQKQLAADLVKQGSDLGSAIATVEANVRADAQGKYDALTAGQKKIADDLMRQGVTLTAAINTAVGTATADIKADAQVKYDALSAGQKKLADDLMRQGVDLGTAISTAQAQLGGQIADLGATIGRPGGTATRSDLDAIIGLLGSQGAYDRRYDYNGDGTIDGADRDAIANYLGGTATGPFNPATGTVWAPSGIYGTMAENQAALEKKIADEAEATRAANAARMDANARLTASSALKTQRMGNLNSMMGMMAQPNAMGGQRAAAPAAPPDPAKIGYVYDFGSIFANPAQEKLFVNPYGGYAQGGAVRSEMDDVNDELLKILKG